MMQYYEQLNFVDEQKPEVNRDFIIWLAGYMDGEANVGVYRRNFTDPRSPAKRVYIQYRAAVSISSVNIETLLEIKGNFGGSIANIYPGRYNGGKSRPAFNYSAQGGIAKTIAGLTLPYLRLKKRQAELVLQFPLWHQTIDLPPGYAEKRECLYVETLALNKRGNHPTM